MKMIDATVIGFDISDPDVTQITIAVPSDSMWWLGDTVKVEQSGGPDGEARIDEGERTAYPSA